MKRRKFIKYASLAGGSLALGYCGPRAETQVRNSSQLAGSGKIGVALLGLGTYSTTRLAPGLQMTGNCYLAGIVTGSPEKIPVWQEKYGIKDRNVYNYENMHQIANNDEIDVIYIVVPTGLHAQYALKAADTGKHVWCEKPMAMNVAECQSIIDACQKNKLKLSIGYRMQHEPNTQTVIQYAQTKPYGKIEELEALAGYNGGGGTGWRFQKDMGGGALYDMGVYCINALRFATGQEPILVESAEQSTKRPQIFTEVDETTKFTLQFPRGVRGFGHTSVGQYINRLRVDCAEGWYELSPMQTYSGVEGRTSDGTLLDQEVPHQQAKQMDDNALAILNDQPVLVPGEEGLRDIHIVNTILESVKSGQSVKI